MNPDQVPNNSRDDERTRDKERKTKKPRERDKDNKKKNNDEDSGGTNRETSREMTTRQTNVQPNGRFPGFSFLIYLFRLLSGSVTATRFIKEFIAAINGNQENRLVRFTNYPSFDREGPNQNLNFSIYFPPICPQTRNVPATLSLGYPCLLNRIGLVFPQVFRTSDNWKFTFARTAMTTNLTFCQLWISAPASTSQTSSPDIVVPAFAENEDSNMMAARGRNFPRVLTRARETIALLYQLFRLITFDSVSEETLQQLINTVQRVLQYDGNSAINIIAGVVPALALGDNQQTTMFGVVYARGITYGTVPRIPAVSSPCGESSFLDDMAATENPILGEGSRQMAHDGRQFDDNIAEVEHDGRQFDDHIAEGEHDGRQFDDHIADGEHDGRQFDDYIAEGEHDGRQFDDHIADGEHDGRQLDDYIAEGEHDGRQFDDNIAEGEDEVYVADQITRNEEGNPNADALLKYPTQCEDPHVTPTYTDEYGRPGGQAEASKSDLSNQENTCKFPVMETGWEVNAEDVQDNDATEINEEIPIQCEEDLHLTRYNNVSGCMSRDYGAPDSCSHGGARSRPATQGRLQMRQAVLYAQCEQDLLYEYTWKLEEGDRQRRSLLCPECHTSPWSVVLIPCGHLLCSYCYHGQGICPRCLKKVITSSHVLLS